MKYAILDTVTKEVVAQRGTKPSAEKWCARLCEGLPTVNGLKRYNVTKIA